MSTVTVELDAKTRAARGLELAAALAKLYEHQEEAKLERNKLKAKEDELQAEVKRLQRAVQTGYEEVDGQRDMFTNDPDPDAN